jgi:hypothetical protein
MNRCLCVSRSSLPLLLVSAAVALSGCGQETYENRLKATNAYYGYVEDVNANLEAETALPFGVKIRVPKEFKLIPAPKADAPDERVNSTATRVSNLPGVLAKWQRQVQTDDGGRHVAELFLVSNHQRYLDYDPTAGELGAPANLLADLDYTLQEGLGITISPMAMGAAENAWLPARTPPVGQIPYTIQKTFEQIRLMPPESPEIMPHRIGHATRYEVPVGKNKIQVALICLYPARMRDATKVGEQLLKTMDQLQVAAVQPIKPKPGQKGGAGGTPAPSAF